MFKKNKDKKKPKIDSPRTTSYANINQNKSYDNDNVWTVKEKENKK